MKRIVLILLSLLVVVPGWAQLLWKVDGGGLERPSYIVGTHHFAPVGMIDSIEGLREVIGEVDAVYGEIHEDSLATPAAQQAMMQAVIAPPDSTLNEVLSEEEWAVVDTVVRKYMGAMGLNLELLAALTPAGLSLQLQALQAQVYFPGYDPRQQLDRTVQLMGRAMGKELGSLETVDDQLHLLFDVPIKDQAEALVEMCRADDEYLDVTRQMADAYVAEDLDAMLKLLLDPVAGEKPTPEELDRLVWGRNRNWVSKLLAIMPRRSVLVCVGAGHLPGEQGLISLLREAGYSVEPMVVK